ncbi:cache domain-containing protein [Candidatus Poriferisodalis sp.]|uniref:cache domain-containing protein n=1 Tax=Candidatus Poriferisodalis sp. TaxID=3101277 RepID=UPI003AF8ABC2
MNKKNIALAVMLAAVTHLGIAGCSDEADDGDAMPESDAPSVTAASAETEGGTAAPVVATEPPTTTSGPGSDDGGSDDGDSDDGGSDDGDSDDGDSDAMAAAPPKSEAVLYTRWVVDSAIEKYRSDGREATLAHYSDIESVDDQWYVFIVDTEGEVLAHFDPERVGSSLTSWVGVDAGGYAFGPEMLAADENGTWVTYVFQNPATGDLEAGDFGETQLKSAWVVRHDGLLFASGYYINADGFVEDGVAAAIAGYDESGLDGYTDRFSSSDSVLGSITATLAYYNTSNFDARWIVFVANRDGEIISAFFDPELEGRSIVDVLGSAALDAGPEGVWITEADNEAGTGPAYMRSWVVRHDGLIFGAARTDWSYLE